jgi:ubiquinone/menaquinone biosynthesis C-methylase UbiE
MDEPIMPFDEFERRGWGDAGLAIAYHEHLSDLTRQSVGPLLDAARVEAGTRVLDVATGPGYAAAAASARGAVATGLDLSAELIALARTLHAGVDFVEGDAMALPFEDGTVDAVVSNYGMPHFPDADAFLREASGSR